MATEDFFNSIDDSLFSGRKIRARKKTIGGNDVYERTYELTDADGDTIARVVTGDPGNDYAGLVMRPLVTRTGTLTGAAPIIVDASIASVSIIAANTARRALWLYMTSTDPSNVLYLNFFDDADADENYVMAIGIGLSVLPSPIWTGAIQGIWSIADGKIRVTEFI